MIIILVINSTNPHRTQHTHLYMFRFILSRYMFRTITCSRIESILTCRGECVVFCMDWYCWWSVYTTACFCPKLSCSLYRKPANAHERVPSKINAERWTWKNIFRLFVTVRTPDLCRQEQMPHVLRYVVNTEKEIWRRMLSALYRFTTKMREGVNIAPWLE